MPDNGTTTQTQPQAIQKFAPQPLSIEPESLTAAIDLCKRFADADIVPAALRRKPNDILVVALTGRDLGLSFAQSLRAIYVVNGRPSLSTQFKIAKAQQHPDCLYFRLVESAADKATWETHRRGEPAPVRITWTIEQAKTAGLIDKKDSIWKAYPENMLRWRAASALCDAVYADSVYGLPSTEEVRDMEPEPFTPLPRDVTPPPTPATVAPVDAEFKPVVEQPVPAPKPEENLLEKAHAAIAAAKTQADLSDVAGMLKDAPPAVRNNPDVRSHYAQRMAEIGGGK
jgi:hypothetical protein